MPVRRILAALATAVTVLAASASVDYADTITNNVTVGGNDTTTVGSSTTVGYTLNAAKDSTSNGCNARGNAPVSVTVAVTVPVGTVATVSPSILSFADCTTTK